MHQRVLVGGHLVRPQPPLRVGEGAADGSKAGTTVFEVLTIENAGGQGDAVANSGTL